MKTQFQSVSTLKALARALALVAAWALIADIQPTDTASSRSTNVSSSLPVVTDSPSHAIISLSIDTGRALQACDPNDQRRPVIVSVADGSTPGSSGAGLAVNI